MNEKLNRLDLANLPSEDDRLSKVFQHEGERRSRVGQGVGPVKHHEAVEQLVRVLDVLSNLKGKK